MPPKRVILTFSALSLCPCSMNWPVVIGHLGQSCDTCNRCLIIDVCRALLALEQWYTCIRTCITVLRQWYTFVHNCTSAVVYTHTYVHNSTSAVVYMHTYVHNSTSAVVYMHTHVHNSTSAVVYICA